MLVLRTLPLLQAFVRTGGLSRPLNYHRWESAANLPKRLPHIAIQVLLVSLIELIVAVSG